MNAKHLVIGGARSGKSSFAEREVVGLAAQAGLQLNYLATATAEDEEMKARILKHKGQRLSQSWNVVEEPLYIGSVIEEFGSSDIILIDCLTLWLSNCLHADNWIKQREHFISKLSNSKSTIFMVSNEVGQGIVPLGELSRRFVDESGWLHQELANICSQVTWVIAGLPTKLKPS